jgi:hypothetical protein
MERSPWAFDFPPSTTTFLLPLSPPFFIERRMSIRWCRAGPTPFSYSSFYFPLFNMVLFKDRVVAMGKPHYNSSIRTFRFFT